MKLTIETYDPDTETFDPNRTRELHIVNNIGFHSTHEGIRVILGEDGPDVLIEAQPDGWVIHIHNDVGEYKGKVSFPDTGDIKFSKEG